MRKFWFVHLVMVITLPVLQGYLRSGYPASDDGFWAVVRQAEMHREIKDLQIPPRWSGYLNHGYGYPLFLFTYPMPYYVGELFHVGGLGVIATVKLLFILGTIISAVCMFFLSREYFGNWGGIFAAILYVYAPYKLVNLYIRGSLGEVVASLFFPLLFFLYKKLIERPTRWLLVITTGTCAAFILTHNASVILFLPFLGLWILYLLWQEKKVRKERLLVVVITGILALLLTAFFWLPALTEKKFIALSVTPLTNKTEHFLTVPEFLGQKTHAVTGLPLGIGVATLVIAVAGTLIIFFRRKKTSSHTAVFLVAMCSLLSLLLLFRVSSVFWQLPLFKEIDFPWRMLGVSIFFLAFVGSSLVNWKIGKFIAPGIVVLLFILTPWQMVQVERHYVPDTYFETNDGKTTSNDELMPIWVREKPTHRPAQKVVPSVLTAEVTNIQERSTGLSFVIKTDSATSALINTVYFPGWKVYVDNQTIEPKITEKTGLMEIPVSAGTHSIEMRFTDTPLRQIANSISLFGIISIIGVWIFSKKLFRI